MMFFCLWLFQELTWYEHYEEGTRAFNRKEYQVVIENMDAALSLKPKEQKDVFIRAAQKIDYKPNYYKALAQFRLENIEAAMEAARQAFSGEVVQKTPNLQNELMPIFKAYSERVSEFQAEIKAEQEIIRKRNEALEELLAGNPDKVRTILQSLSVSESSKFEDIKQLLSMLADVDQKSDKAKQDGVERIQNFLSQEKPEMAEAALQGISTLLEPAEINGFIDQIELIKQAQANTEQVENNDKVALEAELIRGQSQIKNLEEEGETLKKRLRLALTQNQELRDQSQKVQSREVTLDFPAPVLSVHLNPQGKSVDLEGAVFTPGGLDQLTVFLNHSDEAKALDLTEIGNFEYKLEETVNVGNFGNHRLVLEVRDLQGKISRVEKEFHLEIPYYLKPSLYVYFLSLCLATALLFWTKSQLHRRRARLIQFNPYIAGSPIMDEHMFFGRSELIQRIHSLVRKNCMMIYGERRMGKTSLLYQLKRTLTEPHHDVKFYPAFVDLQGIQEADLFHHVMAEILQTFPEWEALGLVYQEHESDYRPRHFSKDLKTIVTHLRSQAGLPPCLVLLMDEVDVINEFSEKTNQKLRSVFMKDFSDSLSCIMAGIHLKKEWESSGSPWYNFFEEIPMTQLEDEAAKQLILKPTKGIFKVQPEATRYIMQSCSGHPYYIQKLMVSLVARLTQSNKFEITRPEVETTLRLMKEETERIQGTNHDFDDQSSG